MSASGYNNAMNFLAGALLMVAVLPACRAADRVADNAPAGQPSAATVQYTVRIAAPQTQMLEISMRVPSVESATIDFQLPVWRPGRYEVLNQAGTVRGVKACDGENAPLAVQKIDKSTWRVTRGDAAEPTDISLSYRIFANSLADRTRHVDDTHAFLSGAAVFMYVPQLRRNPIEIHIEAPPDWRIATGLSPAEGDPRSLHAPNYDVLVDSPIEIGIHEVIDFEAVGKPHQIVIWGQADYDEEKLRRDIAKIVEAEAAIFGGAPYAHYVFIIQLGDGIGGGTEHLNSTVIQTSRASMEEPKPYRDFLSLVAHEMFHTWNVKQFRPKGIHPYDYQHENYTDLLWVCEGTTSYYDDLIPVRAGLHKPNDYLKKLSEMIDAMRRRPGELVQSVADASFDAWIQHYKPAADGPNAAVSFYIKGALVSLLLDLTIRSRTENARSLDDVMRTLYERFPIEGTGYTSDDLLRIVEELTNSDWDDFFARFVKGADALNFEEVVSTVGLELYLKPTPPEKKDDSTEDRDDDADQDKDGGETEPEPGVEDQRELKESAYLGVGLRDTDGRAIVAHVFSDGPAYGADVLVGDEVLALNGRRLSADELDARLKKLKAGDQISLALFRRDELRTISITLTSRPDGKWTMRRAKDATDAQKAAYSSWLGQPWPAERAANEWNAGP